MIVNVPFAYDAQVVYQGKRSVESVTLTAETPCLVQSTAAESAPIAAWFSLSRDAHFAIRSFEGKLYRPVVQDEDHVTRCTRHGFGSLPRPVDESGAVRRTPDPIYDIALASSEALASRLSKGMLRLNSDQPEQRDYARLEDLPIRRVEMSHREAVAENVQKFVSQYLVIDDVVYRSTPCPIYWVDFVGNGKVTPTFAGSAVYGGGSGIYGIESHEEALEAFRGYLVSRNRWDDRSEEAWSTKSEWFDIPLPPEIIRPELLDMDVMGHALDCTVANVIRRMSDPSVRWGETRLAGLPKEAVMAYGVFRDAAKALDVTGPEPVLVALAELKPTLSPHGTLSDIEDDIGALLARFDRQASPQIGRNP